jgi:hypothetical protein
MDDMDETREILIPRNSGLLHFINKATSVGQLLKFGHDLQLRARCFSVHHMTKRIFNFCIHKVMCFLSDSDLIYNLNRFFNYHIAYLKTTRTNFKHWHLHIRIHIAIGVYCCFVWLRNTYHLYSTIKLRIREYIKQQNTNKTVIRDDLIGEEKNYLPVVLYGWET